MNKRQRKKLYQQQHGYNPDEENRVQQMIKSMIEYADQRLAEVEKERLTRRYAGFLENIKKRKGGRRWWRTTK